MIQGKMHIVFSILAGLTVGVVGCSGPTPEGAGEKTTLSIKQSEDLSAEALRILNEKCVICHGAERYEKEAFSPEEWNEVIERMVAKGARLSGDELEVLRHWRPGQ